MVKVGDKVLFLEELKSTVTKVSDDNIHVDIFWMGLDIKNIHITALKEV